MNNSVADFYNGKSVLVTGPAGFLGEVLLEALLRCCPGIKKIYGVLRNRRGVNALDRKEQIFQKRVFEKLRQDSPEVLDKFQVVVGDVSQPDLGMNEDDLKVIKEEVSIIFHAAACISFIKSLRFILTHNALSTYYVIQLCKKLKHCDALVYTSTAFSNSNLKTRIREMVYRLPHDSDVFIDAIMNGSDENMEKLVAGCFPAWPNSYTFSKCLAENIVADKASDLKVAIIRPSLIISTWKAPLVGYAEDNSGLTSISIGVGKGVIRVLYGDPNSLLDIIPVDVVANTHIITAYLAAVEKVPSPFVVNCVGYGYAEISFGHFVQRMLKVVEETPIPLTFQNPNLNIKVVKSRAIYSLMSFYEHYIPAYVMDAFLRLSGKKARLVSIYRFFDKAMTSTYYFLTNSWQYQTTNFHGLKDKIEPNDQEIFFTDLSGYDMLSLANSVAESSPFYEWKIDKRSPTERKKIALQRNMMTTTIKRVVLMFFLVLLYFLVVFVKSFWEGSQ